MSYRLRIENLKSAASKKGDGSGYAIAKRTGLAESTVSRILNGRSQPGAKALTRFCDVYDVTTEVLMESTEVAA
jgi:transcriptional regulator with XRE-family HTH domain